LILFEYLPVAKMPFYTEEDVMNVIYDVTENGVSLSKAAA
jgi:hypothetical protein